MQSYEYRVVPAPRKGEKAKGLKTVEARFAHALMDVMNELGREGWEYIRTDTLPAEERVGFTGRTTNFHHMMVFRRTLGSASANRPSLSSHQPEPEMAAPVLSVEAPVGAPPALGPARGE